MGHELKKSPLAPEATAMLLPVAGVKLAVGETGTRYKGRTDLMVATLPAGTTAAGVFTTSKTSSAPVDISRAHLSHGEARAVVVNSGNANAFTGKKGEKAAYDVINAVAQSVGCAPQQVFAASTGVIGVCLEAEPIVKLIGGIVDSADEAAWNDAAAAIMTTDTFAKLATVSTSIDGTDVVINGIAKGSGMIAPDMATMLVFMFTDAAVPADILQALLVRAVDKSFNAITVDSDTSTSDTVLLFATGKTVVSGVSEFNGTDDERLKGFSDALEKLSRDLAHQVVRDGEGAQKFISIKVNGAQDDLAARRIGMAIGNSPLVKTAIAGEDANWGRIVMAVGKSGEAADRDLLSIHIGGIRVAHDGEVDPDYREEELVPHMQGREIDIQVDVGVGDGSATVWTCDLTHQYIEINADYRS